MSNKLKLTLITTGGTLDGTCSDLHVLGGQSLLKVRLSSIERFEVETVAVCNKDSRDLSDWDREEILSAVVRDSSGRIIIGHGTYTICETGRFLKSRLPNCTKRVLLLGSWIPLDFPDSDAERQIQFASQSIESCPPGVFVSMDDQLWDPDKTVKRKNLIGDWCLVSAED